MKFYAEYSIQECQTIEEMITSLKWWKNLSPFSFRTFLLEYGYSSISFSSNDIKYKFYTSSQYLSYSFLQQKRNWEYLKCCPFLAQDFQPT